MAAMSGRAMRPGPVASSITGSAAPTPATNWLEFQAQKTILFLRDGRRAIAVRTWDGPPLARDRTDRVGVGRSPEIRESPHAQRGRLPANRRGDPGIRHES